MASLDSHWAKETRMYRVFIPVRPAVAVVFRENPMLACNPRFQIENHIPQTINLAALDDF